MEKDKQYGYAEIIETLYDLSHTELRQLALECLLITDGPDKVEETNGLGQ